MKKQTTSLIVVCIVLGLISIGAVQAAPGTRHIRDDPTGGDCTLIGVWNAAAKTCTLTTDVNEAIQIDSNGVTLDGDEHIVAGNNTGYGITLPGRTGVTLKNLSVRNFEIGVRLEASSNNDFVNLTVSNNTSRGMDFRSGSAYNAVRDSVFTANEFGIDTGDQGSHHNTFQGIRAYSNTGVGFTGYAGSDYTRILDSQFYDNGRGVIIGWSFFWSLENSMVHSNAGDGLHIDTARYGTVKHSQLNSNGGCGIAVAGLDTHHNEIVGNKIHSNARGLCFWSAAYNNTARENEIYENGDGVIITRNVIEPNYNNLFYHNSFKHNTINALVLEDRYANQWDNGYPEGGNYWSDYYTPAQGCFDLNHDSFCDAPYVLTGGQDHFPWTIPYGWLVADINHLMAEKESACSRGWISKRGICNSLDAKLNAAKAAVERGQLGAAKNQLNAFLNELGAQKGKAVNQPAFDLLETSVLHMLLEHLP